MSSINDGQPAAKQPTPEEEGVPRSPLAGSQHLPQELIDEINKFNVLASFPETDIREYLRLHDDGATIDIVKNKAKTLHRGEVDQHGKCPSFEESLANLASTTNHVLNAILPKMVIHIDTPDMLSWFTKVLSAHTRDFPILHIEIPLFAVVKDVPGVKEWQESEWEEHGKVFELEKHVEKWLKVIADLPLTSRVYLSFDIFWRDFRTLRGVFTKYKVHERVAGCFFASELDEFPEREFLVKETLAAVTDAELLEEVSTYERRKYLVDHGCR